MYGKTPASELDAAEITNATKTSLRIINAPKVTPRVHRVNHSNDVL
jgi:hypothetical protein